MFDLFANNVFPTDIKEDNILIDPSNLNIKLIDLDGIQTRIETKEYINEFQYIKNNCLNNFENMCSRLYRYKKRV